MGVDLPYKYGREELKELEYCSLCFSFSLHCLPENQAHSIMTVTVTCEVECENCQIYEFKREVVNKKKGKELARDLLNGKVRCIMNNCRNKVVVKDRERLKEEWGINDE